MQEQDQVLTPTLTITKTLLGRGSTGNVYLGHCSTPSPHKVAIKSVPLQSINDQVTSYLFQCELQALKAVGNLDNPYIVKLENILVIGQYCHIVMELLDGGTLREYMDKNKRIQETKALKVLQGVLMGYKTLKENNIVHRDLKPSNILFQGCDGDELKPKIIDFGYCVYDKVTRKPQGYYNVGSPRYMAPQAYMDNQYSQKSDIWALGIIFYEMLTGACLDKGKQLQDSFRLIGQKGIPVPASMNYKCRRLLQAMLMIDPKKRMSCQELIEEIKAQCDENDKRLLFSHPHQRSSLVNIPEAIRNSTFLTRSVGFPIGNEQKQFDQRMVNQIVNLLKSKMENDQKVVLNESLKQRRLSDRCLSLNPLQQRINQIVGGIPLRESIQYRLPVQIVIGSKPEQKQKINQISTSGNINIQNSQNKQNENQSINKIHFSPQFIDKSSNIKIAEGKIDEQPRVQVRGGQNGLERVRHTYPAPKQEMTVIQHELPRMLGSVHLEMSNSRGPHNRIEKPQQQINRINLPHHLPNNPMIQQRKILHSEHNPMGPHLQVPQKQNIFPQPPRTPSQPQLLQVPPTPQHQRHQTICHMGQGNQGIQPQGIQGFHICQQNLPRDTQTQNFQRDPRHIQTHPRNIQTEIPRNVQTEMHQNVQRNHQRDIALRETFQRKTQIQGNQSFHRDGTLQRVPVNGVNQNLPNQRVQNFGQVFREHINTLPNYQREGHGAKIQYQLQPVRMLVG